MFYVEGRKNTESECGRLNLKTRKIDSSITKRLAVSILSKAYTGIGSRETPLNILNQMFILAVDLGQAGYTLRSGGADGADTYFEFGADFGEYPKEIYLPWPGFNGRTNAKLDEATVEAHAIAAYYHPNWQYLKRGAKLLHARNVHQVFGPDVSTIEACEENKSDFVICWTKGGKGGGGTGQAIRIADAYNVPVYDLGKMTIEELMSEIKCLK